MQYLFGVKLMIARSITLEYIHKILHFIYFLINDTM